MKIWWGDFLNCKELKIDMWEKRYNMKKRILLTVFGLLLVLGGVTIFLYPNFKSLRTQGEVQSIIDDFIYRREDALTNNKEDPDDSTDVENDSSNNNVTKDVVISDESNDDTSNSEEDIKNEIAELKEVLMPDLYDAMLEYNQDLVNNGQHISDAWDYEQAPIDLISLNDDSSVIGYIDIPDMGVRLPLFLGASMSNLAQGAAVLSQTSMPIGGEDTNCVIAGHRGYQGSAYFQYIDRMSKGSKIYITNPWETLTYEVVGSKIVKPTDCSDILIKPGKDMVTLISCHPYLIGGGPERYLVFAERVDTVSTVSDDGEITILNPPEDTTMEDTSVNTSNQPDSEESLNHTSSDTSENDIVVVTDSMSKLESILRIGLPVFIFLFGSGLILYRRFYKRNDSDDFM